MNREIKFRVWDKKDKKFWYKNTELECFEISLDAGILGLVDVDWEGEERFTLLQYTGLKDSEGKEIYEGDIVEVAGDEDYCNEQVSILLGGDEFESGVWRFKGVATMSQFHWCVKRQDDKISIPFWDLIYDLEVKVIGTIYENPELLEDKE